MFIRFWLSASCGGTVLLLRSVFASYLFDYFVVEHRNGSVARHVSRMRGFVADQIARRACAEESLPVP
jgi:hypothetical protein